MNMSVADLLGRLSDSISQVKIKSVVEAPFKAVLIIIFLAVLSAWIKAPSWVTIVIFSIGGLFALLLVGAYILFSIKNPDYLRSESFQLRMKTLEVLGDKDGGLLPANPKDIILTSAQEVPVIDSEKEDER